MQFTHRQKMEIFDFINQFELKTLSWSKQFDVIKSFFINENEMETIWQRQTKIGFTKLVADLKQIISTNN